MTAQLLSTEIANLIQESKRKNNDLRQAAEKSVEELRSLRGTSEAQVAAELSQRVNFVNPFIIACGTKNAKFTAIAIVCLQRLIVAKALARSKLNQVLEALREATAAGLDVQLKILQALPSLLQNYALDIKGDLLHTALNICFILQTSKNAIVNNTSAATLQQLVVSVFDKVVSEDRSSADGAVVGEAPVQDGVVRLRSAALDAYRVFNDLCLMTENQRPEYLRFTGLNQTFGLELIESVLTNHAAIFNQHPEQAHVLRLRVMPFIISALSGKPNFATTVRLMRILYTMLRRHLSVLPAEGGHAMGILTHLLDQDTALWKRCLCMEVFRGIFAEPGLIRRIYAMYDAKEDGKGMIKNLTATFVRVSTEKPAVIGLGPQSTIPVANPYAGTNSSNEQAMLEASGVTGIITGSVGSEGHNTGISTKWSSVRVPYIDQLDKTEAPTVPESYVYSLTLSCITSLSEGLAKFILPLTVPNDRNSRKRGPKSDMGRDSPVPAEERPDSPGLKSSVERTVSFKKNPIPVNPLLLEDHPIHNEVKICATLIDDCWPAILATCSTFLSAALDSEYYHGLVRAFQKFAHVAGLLHLSTPRDAFLTTLGKSAVPPNVFTASLSAGTPRPTTPSSSSETPNSILSNARGLLSTDNLAASAADKPRQPSFDASQQSGLNTRNLLCLRALLNLGIALGPTLGSSWRIVLETLQQADFVLFTTGKSAGRTPMVTKNTDPRAESEANTLLSNFKTEIGAVETAAARLFESTVDFPNESFIEVVDAVCNLLEKKQLPASEASSRPPSPPAGTNLQTPFSQGQQKRNLSVSATVVAGPNQENQFALAKLGDLSSINIERLLYYAPDISGWTQLTSELISTAGSASTNPPIRLRAAEILVRLAQESANSATALEEGERGKVQIRLLEALRDALLPLQMGDREFTVTSQAVDIEIHKTILEGLKNILENCGESLVSGWELAFEIMGTIFMDKRFSREDRRGSDASTVLATRSGKLIRSSFNSLQLICSDFLASLPSPCFLLLVDTLYKFCSQDDDLNIALTTVTFFWVISDFLSGRSSSLKITEDLMESLSSASHDELVCNTDKASSDAALWLLLLLRLTTVTSDSRLELRNSAIQTLLRIIYAYGDRLSPEAWSICIKSVIFKLLSSIEEKLQEISVDDATHDDESEWNETAVVIVKGVASLLANYLDVLTAHASFNSLWQDLMNHLTTLLDFEVLEVNHVTYSGLDSILAKCNEGSKTSFNTGAVDLAWGLWSRSIPISRNAETDKFSDNQKCLIAYVECLLGLYRLIKADLTVEQVRRMLTLLQETMQQATAGAYASDVEHVTSLQGRILEVLRLVRTDIPGVPSAMIAQVADFVSLAFDRDDNQETGSRKRTYVAMSKESMAILQSHILNHTSDPDIYASGAYAAALSALAKPISLKYQFTVVTKSVQPWRTAITSVLAVLEATLSEMRKLEVPSQSVQEIWDIISTVASGITNADCSSAPTSADIMEDEEFDIASFRKLRELIIPALGTEAIPDKTRKVYAESLFRMSIVHAPAPSEADLIYGKAEGDPVGLSALYKPRHGRTSDPPPSKREKMAYVCLDELFALVASHDAAPPSITASASDPPPAAASADGPAPAPGEEAAQALHGRLARTAAPYLILRTALPLRAYAADHALRGRMPQPLSQRRELTGVLRCLVELRSEAEAIPDTANVESETRKHLLRLYPLLVRAMAVAGRAGDDKVLGLAQRALDVVGGEFGL